MCLLPTGNKFHQLWFVALLLIAMNLPAQNPFVQLYTTNEGLPSNSINWIEQDSKKFIWFATGGGLVRYDGTTFIRYGMSDGLSYSQVLYMKEDFFGRFWLSCTMGKVNFLYQGKIYNEKNEPFLDSLRGLPLLVQDKDHNIYFYNYFGRNIHVLDTTNTVTKYKLPSVPVESNERVSRVRDGMNIKYLTKSDSGDYLIWTQLGLFKTKNLNESPVPVSYSKQNHTILAIGDTIMYDLIPDPITQTSLYVKYLNGYPVDSIEFPVKSSDDDGWVAEDSNGTLWISKYNTGLFCLKNKKIIYQFNAKETDCILRDHEGNIWINSKKGVYKISPNILTFKHFDNTNFQNGEIDALNANPDGGVWCIGGGKVFHYRNNEFYPLNLPRKFIAGNTIIGLTKKSVIINNEDYYNFLLTDIHLLNPDKKTLSGNIQRLPANGYLIINSPKTEISIQNNNNEEISTFSTQNLFHELNKVSGSRAWVCYDSKNRLVLHAGTNNYVVKDDIRVPYEEIQAINGKVVTRHIVLDSVTDLFKTLDDSIYMVNRKKVYNLSSSFTYALNAPIERIIYDEPTLYFSTIRNIYKCDNPLNILENKPVQFEMIDVNFKEIRDILVSNDSLYVASSDGLTILPEEKIDQIRNQIPFAYLESVVINDKESDLYTNESTVKGNARIRFSFNSINYSHNPVIYSYMLEGYDNDWTTGTNRSVDFVNLPRGNYTFKLRVSKLNSPWSEPIEYRIIIKATLWEHPLFYLVLSILFTGFVTLLVIKRKNYQFKRRELDHQLITLEQQALQSMMNPHFIFNSLGSIQNYILQKNASKAGLYLSQFARLIRQNLNAIKAAMINLDEEADRLKNYLDLEKMRLTNKFEYSITIDESIEASETFIPSMMIQPLVENALWHGITRLKEKGMVSVYFQKEDEHALKIIVEDNGIGLKKSALYSTNSQDHLGLTLDLNRKRLELLGEKFNIKTRIVFSDAFPDRENPGTRVEIVVPYSYTDSLA